MEKDYPNMKYDLPLRLRRSYDMYTLTHYIGLRCILRCKKTILINRTKHLLISSAITDLKYLFSFLAI